MDTARLTQPIKIYQKFLWFSSQIIYKKNVFFKTLGASIFLFKLLNYAYKTERMFLKDLCIWFIVKFMKKKW